MEMQVKTKGNNRTLNRTIVLWGNLPADSQLNKRRRGGIWERENQKARYIPNIIHSNTVIIMSKKNKIDLHKRRCSMHHTLTVYCDKMGVATIYHVNLLIISKPKHGYSSFEILTIGIICVVVYWVFPIQDFCKEKISCHNKSLSQFEQDKPHYCLGICHAIRE